MILYSDLKLNPHMIHRKPNALKQDTKEVRSEYLGINSKKDEISVLSFFFFFFLLEIYLWELPKMKVLLIILSSCFSSFKLLNEHKNNTHTHCSLTFPNNKIKYLIQLQWIDLTLHHNILFMFQHDVLEDVVLRGQSLRAAMLMSTLDFENEPRPLRPLDHNVSDPLIRKLLENPRAPDSLLHKFLLGKLCCLHIEWAQ